MTELRALIASPETPEEKAARENFVAWEPAFFDLAHEHGLAAEQVRGLRDAAVDLGQVVGDTGRPASEEDLKRVFDKYKVAPSARAALTKLWRKGEGGA